MFLVALGFGTNFGSTNVHNFMDYSNPKQFQRQYINLFINVYFFTNDFMLHESLSSPHSRFYNSNEMFGSKMVNLMSPARIHLHIDRFMLIPIIVPTSMNQIKLLFWKPALKIRDRSSDASTIDIHNKQVQKKTTESVYLA